MWTDSPSQIIKNKKTQRPKTYFELIERVGADGAYQFKMFMIFMLVWFYTGMILLNTGFLFYNKDFQCIDRGLLSNSCEEAICALPEKDRSRFINKQDNKFNSIAIELGQFHCEDQIYISLAKCSVYVGSFVGFLVFSYLADNTGRKFSMLISLGVCVIGNILVSVSTNLPLASLGLLLSGGGANASINTSLCFFNEVTNQYKRQKYSILVQFSFTMGAIVITSFYYLVPHWRVISIFLITIPSLIALFMVFFYVEETPQFLLKGSNALAIKSLNKISSINFRIKNIIEEEDILCVKQRQTALKQFNKLKLKHIDMLRCYSLRSTTIFASFICFTLYAMYYGSMMVINSLGFDIYSSNFVVQLAELVVFLPTYAYIKELKRKLTGIIAFLIIMGLTAVLALVQVPQHCDMCIQSVITLIFTFFFRAVVAYQFCVFYLYINQLFPTRVTGLGVGTVSAFGSLASILSLVTFDFIDNNILMTIFSIMALCGVIVLNGMEQTQNVKLKAQVTEIQLLKQQQKDKSIISGRNSFAPYSLIKSVIKEQNH